MTEQYLCPSYYDDDNVLQDCECGQCPEDEDLSGCCSELVNDYGLCTRCWEHDR